MPAVILVLIVLSAVAIAAVLLSSDERSSALAMVESAAAFYAAEAGLNEVPSLVDEDALLAMEPGASMDLGWREIGYGSGYHATILRLDEADGGQTLFRLNVAGRARNSRSHSYLSHAFSYSPYPTMDAAIKVRGRTIIEDESIVDGHDVAPQEWIDAGLCNDPTGDRPGIIIEDIGDLTLADLTVVLDGDPPAIEDPTINDATFGEFGGPTRQDLIDLADHVIGIPEDKLNPEIRPSYRPDGSCDTDDPYNWGSNDAGDACFNYFPVIYVKDRGMRASLADSYGQAFVIADAEFDVQATLESGDWTGDPGEFAGIVLSAGCFESNLGQTIYGGIVHDRVDALGCNDQEKGLWVSGNPWDPSMPSPDIHFSSCVIARTLRNSNIGKLFGWHPLERPFEEALQ
jgi:hypothetical protein